MKTKSNLIKAAVIGDPISHSLSPKIHNFLLKEQNINGIYSAIKVEKGNLESAIESMKSDGFSGFNVTIPHKEEIFKICDYKSKSASLTGAVNTVVFTEDGKLFGHNSDAEGFLNNLKNSQKDFDLNGKSAFVIGAGGAARAIIYGLAKSGTNRIYITNRSKNRALTLINDFVDFAKSQKCQIEFLDGDNFSKQLGECDLLVNSTSLGMVGQADLVINLENLKSTAITYDIVYKPLITDLLKSAQSRDNKIVTGLGMLIFQALIGFEMWFKKKPDAKLVEKISNILN